MTLMIYNFRNQLLNNRKNWHLMQIVLGNQCKSLQHVALQKESVVKSFWKFEL